MRRAVHGHHPRGEQVLAGEVARRRADAARNLQGPRRLCHRPEPRQARAVGRRPQPLQAAEPRRQEQRRRAGEVEHPADRPDRLRQDAARADAGAHPRRAVHHGRRDDADRSRLCRRGRREHHPEAAAGGRLQRRAGAARHRLHRRGRQDQPQVRQPLDHPRRVGRGRAAGAAEDHGRHGRLVPPQGGRKHPQQEFLQVDTTNILFICGGAFAGPREDHLRPRPQDLDRLRRQRRRRRRTAAPASSSARSSRRIC